MRDFRSSKMAAGPFCKKKSKKLSCILVEENYSESVTIVRRQRFEGGFHIRKKYSKKWAGVSLPKLHQGAKFKMAANKTIA